MKVPSLFRSITFKLWLSLVCAFLFTLGVAFAVSYTNTQKRFISFSFNQLKEQLRPLEREVLAVYNRDQSLDLFKNNPKTWSKAVRRTLKFTQHINIDPRFSRYNPPPTPPLGKPSQGPKFNYSTKHLHEAQRRFFHTLSLHDSKKQTVAKYRIEPHKTYWHEIRQDGEIIAYISFEKPTYVLKKNEAIFLQKLLLFFMQIAIVMIVVSILTAAIISRWLLSPVTKLSSGASRVTRGDLSTRVQHKSKDELGELCKNFNDMCAKLESNEVARRQWVADISHEMRTPVAVLKAQIEAMLDGIRPLTEDNLKLLSNKIESLEQLINDLYELALSDTGDLKLNVAKVDINELISTFVEENIPYAQKKQLEFSFKSELTQAGLIQIDSLKVLQILHNILNNSLRYTDAPGEIRWRLIDNKDTFVLEAEDSSPGVEESHIEKIFDRLYRIEKSRNRATGGAGLGLPLSRNIAKAHGGTLKASASTYGGLKLSLTLPKDN